MCKRVYLVGIGPGKENQMTTEAQEILRRCDAVIGAKRMVRQAAVLLKESSSCIRRSAGELPAGSDRCVA